MIKGKMIPSYIPSHELNMLDHLQGKVEHDPGSGMRSYKHLDHLLMNPHILQAVHHHSRGGSASCRMAPQVEAHDTELALLGPHTHRVFKQLAGGGHPNPYDGHSQFASLGPTLEGLWNTLKSGAGQAYDTVKPYLPYLGAAAGAAGTALAAHHYAPQLGKAALGAYAGNKLDQARAERERNLAYRAAQQPQGLSDTEHLQQASDVLGGMHFADGGSPLDRIKSMAHSAYNVVQPYLPSGETMKTVGKYALPALGAGAAALAANKLRNYGVPGDAGGYGVDPRELTPPPIPAYVPGGGEEVRRNLTTAQQVVPFERMLRLGRTNPGDISFEAITGHRGV